MLPSDRSTELHADPPAPLPHRAHWASRPFPADPSPATCWSPTATTTGCWSSRPRSESSGASRNRAASGDVRQLL